MTAFNSALFSGTERFLSLIAVFGTMAVLGRLLTPQDFGVFAIVASVQAVFLPLLDLGLTPAFVKIPDADDATSNVFFTLNLVCGLANAMLLLAAAPILWLIYGDPMLVPLCLAFVAAVVVESMSKQRLAIATRDRRFDLAMVARIVGMFSASAAAIAAAFADWGVWTFAVRVVVQAVCLYLAYRLLIPRRFRLVGLAEIKRFRSDIRFAASIVISRILGGVYRSVDKLLFGALFGHTQLGLYSKAAQLDAMPDTSIRTALSTPAYSHIVRHDHRQRVARYLQLGNILFLAAGTPCLLMVVVGDQVITLLMGPQWEAAGIYVQLLALWGVGQIMHGIGAVMHMADDQMRGWIRAHVLATVLLVCFACLGGWARGSLGFVVSISCANLVFWFYVVLRWFHRRAGGVDACLSMARTIAVSFVAVLSTGFLARAALSDVDWHSDWIAKVVCTLTVSALSCAVLTTLHWFLNREQLDSLLSLLPLRADRC